MRLLIFVIILSLFSCNVKYRNIKNTIGSLPPYKLIAVPENGSSGVTSKVDSIINLPVSSNERLEFILDQDSKLANRFMTYKKNKSEINYLQLVDRISEISRIKDIRVNIKFKTLMPGATIKYKVQANNEEITANNLTNECIVSFYIGNYFIWTERNDVKTANPNKYFIMKRDSITISEKKRK